MVEIGTRESREGSRLCLNENSKSVDTKLVYIVKSFPSRVLNQATRVEYQLLHLYLYIQSSKNPKLFTRITINISHFYHTLPLSLYSRYVTLYFKIMYTNFPTRTCYF